MAKKDSPFITTGEKIRNYLGIAIVLSLAIHFVAAFFFPDLKQHHDDTQVEKISERKKIKVKVPTPPPPTPTPAPTPTPPPQATPPPKQVQPQTKIKVDLVKTKNNSSTTSSQAVGTQPKTGSENGVPAGVGQGSPAPAATPAATAAPACANPNHEAVATNQAAPDYPDSARDLNLGPVTVLVKVTVGTTGQLIDATLYQKSGNFAIDQAALRAARASSYAAKVVNCVPTAGDYLFRADFSPD